jgi:hypothetical protein
MNNHVLSAGLLLCCMATACPAAAPEGPGAKPPWEAQYKIKPSEANRLTAADVVGPDWRR